MRERIIDQTTKMFARQGVKSVRMDDIAAEMGISKRTIYEVFGDKEKLIIACLEYFHDMLRDWNKEKIKDAGNVIEEFLIMLEVWDKQVEATYNMMNDVKKFYPKIYQKFLNGHIHQAAQGIRDKLQQGIDEGYLLEGINLNLSISVVGYSLYGVIKKDAVLPYNVSEKEAFKYVISYFIRGIATIKGIKIIDEYLDKKYNNG